MSSPRAGGPSRRRSFTPAQKLQHLAEYEAACACSEGGAYLRREGLYSSLISEWRRLRDAGLLEGKQPGVKIGRPSADQAELARFVAGWPRPSAGCPPPRPPWRSWEKRTRSWSRSPRARTPSSHAGSADEHLR